MRGEQPASEKDARRSRSTARPKRGTLARRDAVERALGAALVDGQLTLHFQPEVNLHTGTFVAIETLVRMPSSPLGHIGADEFVPIAEQSTLIHELGRWVLHGSLAATASWLVPGSSASGLVTAVNVSPQELLRGDFVRGVLTALETAQFDPSRLCLEVTETAVVEAIVPVIRALRELHEHGVRLAIDDFGTGHASLDHLARFPVDTVKIDRSFVAGLTTDRSAEVIVESVIAMAHALGKEVVAEGVETPQQLDILLALGCDIGQGHLFARPADGLATHTTLQLTAPWPTELTGRRASPGATVTSDGFPTARRQLMLPGSGLPAEVNSFIGRHAEIAEAKRLLTSTRILTLTGPGGVGKTRMSVRIGQDLCDEFPDGIWYVELAELREPGLLANTVAEKLRLRDQSARTAVDAVIANIGEDTTLLILDNCEHLIDAAAEFADTVVRACPNLRVLATSRQSLGLRSEISFAVSPLLVPEDGEVWPLQSVLGSDAVRLFMDRATSVLPGFALDSDLAVAVLRLVRRLDGIPLAIELAAARLRSLSLPQLEERLSVRLRYLTSGERNAPARRQTLRGAIDWSHDLCTGAERLMWARASVFSGGFDLDAAERICGCDPIAPGEVLDVIESLIDKSILVRVPSAGDNVSVRYRMLETIREYGEERLAASGEQDLIRRRHRDWYASLTARFADHWMGKGQVAWVGRITADHANIRVALDYCLTTPSEAPVGMRMVTQIDDGWTIRGQMTEARQWLALALASSTDDSPDRAAALRAMGWYGLLLGDLENGPAQLMEAEVVAHRIDQAPEMAYVVHAWGMAALFTGQIDAAIERFADCLVRFRSAGVLRGELFTLFIGGYALGWNGSPRGYEWLSECLTLTTARGEVFWRSWALWGLSQVELVHGAIDEAGAAAREALEYQRLLDNRLGMAFTIGALAAVAERQGDHDRAAMLFGAADSVWLTIGASPEFYAPVAVTHNHHLALTTTALGQAAFDRSHALGSALSLDEAVAYALG